MAKTEAVAAVPTGIGDLLWCWSLLRPLVDGDIRLLVPEEYPYRAKQLEKVLPGTFIDYSNRWTTKIILRHGDIRKMSLQTYIRDVGDRSHPSAPLQLNHALEDGHRLDEFGEVCYPTFKVDARPKVEGFERPLCLYMANPGAIKAFGAFSGSGWAEVLHAIYTQRRFDGVFILGAEWDKEPVAEFKRCWHATRVVDYTGKTTLAEMLALAKLSVGVVAFASGLPIMTTYHGVPTLMVYPKHLNRMVWTWPQEGAPYIPGTFQYGPSPVASSDAVFFATELML